MVSDTSGSIIAYDSQKDKIIKHTLDRVGCTVDFVLERDGETRTMAEEVAQRDDEPGVIAYWKSFRMLRQDKLKCSQYRVFSILDRKTEDDVPKLLIHWIGYTDEETDGAASWEPVKKMLRTPDAHLVRAYLARSHLTENFTRPISATESAASTPKRTRTYAMPPGQNRPMLAGFRGGGGRAEKESVNNREEIAEPDASGGQEKEADGEPEPKKQKRQAKVKAEDNQRQNGTPLKLPSPPLTAPRTTPSRAVKAQSSSSRASSAVPPPPSGSDAVKSASGLFLLDFSVSGLPHEDILKITELAQRLSAKNNSVSITTKVAPLPPQKED